MYHCRCTLETSVTFKPPFIASSVELVGNAGIYENTESTRQAKTTAHNPSECIHNRRRKTCRSEWGKPKTAFPRGKHTLMFRVSLDAKHVSSAFICCLLSFYESQSKLPIMCMRTILLTATGPCISPSYNSCPTGGWPSNPFSRSYTSCPRRYVFSTTPRNLCPS